MQRTFVLGVCASVVAACIELPKPAASMDMADAAADFVVDAGARRPPDGKPYTGSECGTGGGLSGSGALGYADGGATGDGGANEADAAGGGSGPTLRHPVSGEVVITEIMSNPAAVRDDQGEWFELWNSSAIEELDLGGCVVEDGDDRGATIAEASTIAPGAFAVVARSASAGIAADFIIGFSLSNDSDVIALTCDGVEIDRVGYGAGFPLVSGASMSLDPNASEAGANDQAASWCAAMSAAGVGSDLGSPGASNPSCHPGVSDDAGGVD